MFGLSLNEIFLGIFYVVSIFLGFWEFICGLGYAKLYLSGYGDEPIKDTLKFALHMTLTTTLILYPISKLYF